MRALLPCILSVLLFACELDRSPETGDVASLISAIFRVGPEGRELALSNGAEIRIPKGAMSKEAVLGFQAMDGSKLPPLPHGLKAVSLFYAATPHGQAFEKPVEMGIPHMATDHLRAMCLRLDDPQDKAWDPLNAGVEMRKAMAQISTDHFSFYVIAEPVGAGNCGNGVVDEGEACDDGVNDGEYGGCMPGCKLLAAHCGDDRVDRAAGEVCDPPSSCIQAEECGLVSGCSSNRYEGSPDDCTAECISGAVVDACAHGDGCCPGNCAPGDDDDCAACGNGRLEMGETCEDGTDQECPTNCDDRVSCTSDVLVNGGTCQAYCEHEAITEIDDGDGCCPPGADAATDVDCSGECGNGVVDSDMGELCEPDVGNGCPATCEDDNPCTHDLMSGSVENCNIACTHFKISQPADGDMCCPTGQSANTDEDCTAVCGNAQLEQGETCEPGVGGGCPTSCDDDDNCTADSLIGNPSMCDLTCTTRPITLPMAGDDCCPSGANSVTDPDCTPGCGNGALDPGEMCEDGVGNGCPTDCDDRNACTTDTLSGAASDCTAFCSHDPITDTADADGCCPENGNASNDTDCNPICGNGSLEGNEVCEPGVGAGCPTGCDDGDPCTTNQLVGTPGSCNARCVYDPIGTPANGDMCCLPPQGNANNDTDCAPICGNGEVEPGERCDGDCPSAASCDDNDPCTTDSVAGSGCDRRCVNTPITTPASGDMCCPDGANANNDSDCSVSCGNGVVEGNETCDGNCPTSCNDGDPCTTDNLSGAANRCNVRCTNTTITSPVNGDMCCPDGANANNDSDCSPRCGNGVIESPETCEAGVGTGCPSCDDGNACTTDSSTGSASSCNVSCSHTPITAPRSGDGCCPSGAIFSQDSDCQLWCGDGIIDRDAGETCEPGVGGGCPATDAQCDEAGNGCGRVIKPTTCEASCTQITSMASGDQCCPPGANSTVDADCEVRCGNGIVELGELCEGDSCPKTPADCGRDPCVTYAIEGSGCQAQCVESAKAADSTTPDMCCPKGANALQDADCVAVCDNGVVEPGESCEPGVGEGCPTAADCEVSAQCRVGVLTGTRCNARCTTTTITEPKPGDNCCPDGAMASVDTDCQGCGNGIVEAGETCDGNCPTAATCVPDDECDEALFLPSSNACQVECIHSPKKMSGQTPDKCCPFVSQYQDIDCPPTCGNDLLEADELCDGNEYRVRGDVTKFTRNSNCALSATCDDMDACTQDTPFGADQQQTQVIEACQTLCFHTPVAPNPQTLDGCCVGGANANNDADCTPRCGNGVVEGKETCEPTPLAGEVGCAECPAQDGCTIWKAVGNASACNLTCERQLITEYIDGDKCCPGNGWQELDSDCPPPPIVIF